MMAVGSTKSLLEHPSEAMLERQRPVLCVTAHAPGGAAQMRHGRAGQVNPLA